MSLLDQLDKNNIPEHIAIIMDGNGRWAKSRRLPRVAGHRAGVKTLRNLIEHSVKIKLNTITESRSARNVNQIIEFKVQIASGKNRIATKSYNFNGLKDVEIISFSGLYKYYYGANTNYSAMAVALSNAKSKGYRSAFIVAFKNGRKISVQEALKIQQD